VCFQSDLTSLLRYFRFPGWLWEVVSGQPMLSRTSAVENRQSPWNLWNFGLLPPTLIFNTNLHIAHRKISRKFGVAGNHRFCAVPPTHVCGGQTDGQTDRRLCHSKDKHCLPGQCSSKTDACNTKHTHYADMTRHNHKIKLFKFEY